MGNYMTWLLTISSAVKGKMSSTKDRVSEMLSLSAVALFIMCLCGLFVGVYVSMHV